MASGIVRSNIAAIVSEAPSSSDRGLKLKEFRQLILQRSSDSEKLQESFDNFSHSIGSWLEETIQATAGRYKAKSAKRTKLWSTFNFMNCVFRVMEFYGPLGVSCCLNWNWRIVTGC